MTLADLVFLGCLTDRLPILRFSFFEDFAGGGLLVGLQGRLTILRFSFFEDFAGGGLLVGLQGRLLTLRVSFFEDFVVFRVDVRTSSEASCGSRAFVSV
jgi:hypothetical protein